jgi:hypothetical protein
MAEKAPILITRVLKHSEGRTNTGAQTLVYELETDTGATVTLAVTISAAKELRGMPEKLPADLGRTSGLGPVS